MQSKNSVGLAAAVPAASDGMSPDCTATTVPVVKMNGKPFMPAGKK